jgi:outer membrane protein assembly factor BamB
LSATTGEKLWQVALTQHFVGGAVDAGSSDAYLLCDQPSELIIIDGNSGGLRKRVKLSRSATGPPVVLNRNGRRSLIIPLASALELRSSNGDLERTIQLESPPITPAVVVSHGNLQLVVVGTRRGLLTIDGTTFVPTRWISIGGDQHPLGVLSVANIDESEAPALVMISDRGRVITIDPFAGTVKWIADEGQSATGVAFADLDGDAVLDVIVPGDNNFARGLSGRDGTVIWQTEDRTNNLSSARRRQLITVNTRTGKRLLIGPDSNFIGLRAVELPEPTSATLP